MVEEDPDKEAYYELGRGNSTVPVGLMVLCVLACIVH